MENLDGFLQIIQTMRETGLKFDEYAFCRIAYHYQTKTGWVECGVNNNYPFAYPLRMYIGSHVNLYERQNNRIFKSLQKKNLIEVSPCKQRFRVVGVF